MTDTAVRRAIAEAPATVANVAVGFDVLSFALPVAFDRVAVERNADGDREVRITAVEGGAPGIPTAADRNTAGVALLALVRERRLPFGFTLTVMKGIPLSSGMGGSAASAVAAVVAANALLDEACDDPTLCRLAVEGEAAASGARHADNAAAALHGGLVLVLDNTTGEVAPLPVPPTIVCSLVHPHLRVDTRDARAALSSDVSLALHAQQSAHLAGFVSACHRGDTALIGRCLRDVIVEPQRASLIPGFQEVQRAGLEAGALGLSIAGAGPSLFAWSDGVATAEHVTAAMQAAFEARGTPADAWTAPVAPEGARVVERSS